MKTMSRSEALAARRRLLGDLSVEERVLEIAGTRTTLVEGGAGAPMVLLHGQGGSVLAWVTILPRLLQRHRVIVPDLPGLGETVITDMEIGSPTVVSWLDKLIAKTCDVAPAIVGLSLGGTIAAHFAVQRSDACRIVVLADSGSLGQFRPDPRVLPALVRVSIRPTQRNIERLFRYTSADLDAFKGQFDGAEWQDFLGYGMERNASAAVRSANRQMLRRLGTKQIPDDQLRSIESPVALVWGRDDRIMKVEIAEEASRKFGWPIHVIDNCGHASSWDQPDRFVDIIDALAVE